MITKPKVPLSLALVPVMFLIYLLKNINPVALLPSISSEAPHNCLQLIEHFLSPCDDLQETPMSKTDFS